MADHYSLQLALHSELDERGRAALVSALVAVDFDLQPQPIRRSGLEVGPRQVLVADWSDPTIDAAELDRVLRAIGVSGWGWFLPWGHGCVGTCPTLDTDGNMCVAGDSLACKPTPRAEDFRAFGLPTQYSSVDAWHRAAVRIFGPNPGAWRFKCPACGFVQSVEAYRDAGAPAGAVGYSCVGRWLEGSRRAFGTGDGPCHHAGGARIIVDNPVAIQDGDQIHRSFQFDGEVHRG